MQDQQYNKVYLGQCYAEKGMINIFFLFHLLVLNKVIYFHKLIVFMRKQLFFFHNSSFIVFRQYMTHKTL